MLTSYVQFSPFLSQAQMHIPDGYLSPLTSLVMFLLILPFWVRGARSLRQRLNARLVPLVALFAAFSFVIMMFNVPLPGGTTGHAVGGALAAIILGPEIASLAISIALILQALFFGDGGILAIGANCFNMAVVLPYTSYAIYQFIARNSPLDSRRRPVAAMVGGWIGLNLAAFFTAVEFGIQPLLFKAADGTPLYAPFPLSVAIPAMMIPHMLIASVVEGLVTGAVVAYLQRVNQPLLMLNLQPQAVAESVGFRRMRLLWVVLAVLIILTPLGLLAPGTAWGEWSSEELTQIDPALKAIPQGLRQLEGLWGAPLAGYTIPGLGNANLGYVISAVVGIVLIGVVAWLFTVLLTSGQRSKKVRDNG